MRTHFAFRAALLAAVVALLSSRISVGADSTAPAARKTADSAPAADSIESKYLTGIRQVTSGFNRAGEGYFSPDGHTIIYQAISRDYPFYQIYTQSLDAGKPEMVSTGRGKCTCSFFNPDGKSIIFASSHSDPDLDKTEETGRRQAIEDAKPGAHRKYQWDFDANMEIYHADLLGRHLERLTNSKGYDAECSYSSDGKQIVFCSDRGGNPNIYIMHSDGSEVRQVTHATGYNGGPFFSPDGQWVVFRSDRKKAGFLQLYAIKADGTHETPLTDDENTNNWAPYWHPHKPWIVWTAADQSNPAARPNFDLWLVPYKIAGDTITVGQKIRITDNPAADVLPVFSPDGKRLMWTSNRTADHTSQLYIADVKLPE